MTDTLETAFSSGIMMVAGNILAMAINIFSHGRIEINTLLILCVLIGGIAGVLIKNFRIAMIVFFASAVIAMAALIFS